MADLSSKHIAVMATNGFEDSELTEPLHALKEAGASVVVISDEPDTITGQDGTEVTVDVLLDDISADELDGLVIPGGVANPDKLRTIDGAVDLVRDMFDQGKTVAAICHGPWLLIEADIVDGRTVTSWPSLKTDLLNAGANWVDEEVVVDKGLVTSRNPDDLPAFNARIIEEFAQSDPEDQTI